MKNILFFLLVSCSVSVLVAQQIKYFEGSIEELKKKAKKERKYVVVDVYTDWCGMCKKLERQTFPNPIVKDYLDMHFILYKINAEKGEGITYAEKMGVSGYPTLLFYDFNFEKLGRQIGYAPPNIFLDILKDYAGKPAILKIPEDIIQKKNEEIKALSSEDFPENYDSLRERTLEIASNETILDFEDLLLVNKENLTDRTEFFLKAEYYKVKDSKEKLDDLFKEAVDKNFLSTKDMYGLLWKKIEISDKKLDDETFKLANKIQRSTDKKDYQILELKAIMNIKSGHYDEAMDQLELALKYRKKQKKELGFTQALMDYLETVI